MRSLFWTSVVIGTTLVLFLAVVITTTVVFVLSLKDTMDPTDEAETESPILAVLGINAPRNAPRKPRPKLPKDNKMDLVQMAIKYGAPILSEIPAITNVSFLVEKVPDLDRLNFTEMATQVRLPCQEYEVLTKDGYVLQLFRVQGSNSGVPVLLVHGFLDSADTFLLRGTRSLVAVLAAAGKDVWILNFRGNKYSRRHKTLDPDKDKSFWNFSFHEFGMHDLPEVIDFVLAQTDRSRLQAISHSQGSTVFFVMGAMLPQYNDKIDIHISMAPLCHLDHLQPPLSQIILAETVINIVLKSLGKEEIFGSSSQVFSFLKSMCSYGYIGGELCLEGGFFYLLGRDHGEVKLDFLPLLFAHFPSGTSLRNMNHLAQLYLKHTFAQYDYGFVRNWLEYTSFGVPAYDLAKVTMKTVVFASRHDKIATWQDTQRLKTELPNAEFRTVSRRDFTHIDYIWGENVYKYLYPQLLDVLEKYVTKI